METATSIVTSALEEIHEAANEQPIQTVDFNRAVLYLNRMMAALSVDGISLGYTVVTSAASEITVPAGAIEGMVFNLALKLAPTYDIAISQDLRVNAANGLKSMRKIAVVVKPTSFPCTLPIGSGNEQENTFNNNHFYGCPADELLTEQEGSILLESGTHES